MGNRVLSIVLVAVALVGLTVAATGAVVADHKDGHSAPPDEAGESNEKDPDDDGASQGGPPRCEKGQANPANAPMPEGQNDKHYEKQSDCLAGDDAGED